MHAIIIETSANISILLKLTNIHCNISRINSCNILMIVCGGKGTKERNEQREQSGKIENRDIFFTFSGYSKLFQPP